MFDKAKLFTHRLPYHTIRSLFLQQSFLGSLLISYLNKLSPPEVDTFLHQTPDLLMVEKMKSRGVKHRLQVWDDTIWCQYQYQMSVPASSKYTAAS